jgi:vacuolar protein sorting-associated protein 13A/C
MGLGVQLASMSLTDNSALPTKLPEYKQIFSIEGSNFLDLTYETFDTLNKPPPDGANSAVSLRSGSVRVHFLERPIHDIYAFVIKFAQLKSFYDSATQAAVQRASDIQRMLFDVVIQSPVIIIPDVALDSNQRLVVRLGGIAANNKYSSSEGTIHANLTGISLLSEVFSDSNRTLLSIVDAVDIETNITQLLEGSLTDVQRAESEVLVCHHR